jgi:hypothetical protein
VKTASYALTTADRTIVCKAVSAITLTLPTAVGHAGTEFVIKNDGTSAVVGVAAQTGETVAGAGTTSIRTGHVMTVVSDGSAWTVTQFPEVAGLAGVPASDAGLALYPVTQKDFFSGVLLASSGTVSGIDVVSNPAAGAQVVFLNADNVNLLTSATPPNTTVAGLLRPVKYAQTPANFYAAKRIAVIRPTANGYTLNAPNVLGWTQPSTAAMSMTVYTLEWFGAVAGYWAITSRVVFDLSTRFTGIYDPVTYGAIVMTLPSTNAEYSHLAATSAFLTRLANVKGALAGIVVHFKHDSVSTVDDITNHPLYVSTTGTIQTTRSHYQQLDRVVHIGWGSPISLSGSRTIYWTYVHELCHVFDFNYFEAQGGIPSGSWDGSTAMVVSDYIDFYNLHVASRNDGTLREYFRHGQEPSGWTVGHDLVTSPTEVDFARGRKEWFAECFGAWLLYNAPGTSDTAVAESIGTAACGTLARFTAFRVYMDSFGLV